MGGRGSQGTGVPEPVFLYPSTLHTCPAMLVQSEDTASYSFRKSSQKPEGKRSISLP